MQQAGDAQPDHHSGLAELQAEPRLRVHARRQDLQHHSVGGGQVRRQRVQPGVGDGDQPGEAAVIIAAHQAAVRA